MEMNQVDNYTTYLEAAEHALANFLGTDDLDEDMINLVADCARQAVAVLPNWTYFNDLLEKSSSYVQTDLDECELVDYVGELETQLGDYGLI
jgi:hypothetical protein